MVNLISHVRALRNTRQKAIERLSFGLLGAYAAYRFWRRHELAYQAEVAKEFCPGELKTFSMCVDSKKECITEMVYLHDCIYRQRGLSQVTFNQLKIK